MATIISNDVRVTGSNVRAPSQSPSAQQQDAALLELARTLQELADKGSSARAQGTQGGTDEVSNARMRKAMVELSQLLADLQTSIAEWGKQRSDSSANINQLVGDAMRAKVERAVSLLTDIVQSSKNSKTMEDVSKGIGIVVSVIGIVAACAAMQPQLAVVLGAMLVLSETGVLDKAREAISDGLQKNQGMDRDKADILAAAIVIVSTVVVTAGASAGASAAVGARTAATTAEGVVATSSSRAAQAVGIGVTAGASAVGATNFGSYLATVALSKMDEGTEKEILSAVIQIAVLVATLVAGMRAGCGGGTPPAFLNTLRHAAEQGERAGNLLQMLAAFGEGGVHWDLSSKMADLARTQATTDLLRTGMDSADKDDADRAQLLEMALRGLAENIAETGRGFVQGIAAYTKTLQS